MCVCVCVLGQQILDSLVDETPPSYPWSLLSATQSMDQGEMVVEHRVVIDQAGEQLLTLSQPF